MTSQDLTSATSLPGEGSGASPPASQDGMTLDLFGPAVAPASRSARQGKEPERMIQGICGRTFIASSVPEGPLSSWESRLRERLGMVGSTEYALIWRVKTTPAGASISRLAPSMRHTNGTGSTGQESPWATPRASDGEKGGPNQSFGAGGQPLPAQMHQSAEATARRSPNSRENGGGSYSDPEKAKARLIQINLEEQMVIEASAWPTPTVADAMGGHLSRSGKRSDELLLKGMMKEADKMAQEPQASAGAGGPTPSGSSAMTEKRGAPNPVFAFWLMGFPDEWIYGALEAMQLFRLRPRKSLPRSSKRS